MKSALAGLLLLFPLPSVAHESGAAYLRVEVAEAGLHGELDLGLGDALTLLGLPQASSAEAAWSAVDLRSAVLAQTIAERLDFESGGRCPLRFDEPPVARAEDPGWLRLAFAARCPAPVERLVLRYALLFDLDPSHRVFAALQARGRIHSTVLSADAPQAELDLRPPSALSQFATYLREGTHHVLSGADHLLFLTALLLPAALTRTRGRWLPRPDAAGVLVEVATLVSAFTLAHSLTLCLAALDIVRAPSRAVEVLIALSVLVAALSNLRPLVLLRPWRLAFGFGLVHGFGFASQLGLLGLPPTARGVALLGFNLGVEAGQLLAVALTLPLLLALRQHSLYRVAVLEIPSVAIAWLAGVWLVERAFGISLLGWI